MSSDPGARLPGRPRVDFSLPGVLDIQVRVARFAPPRLSNFESSIPRTREAIEFVVTTDGPIPIRALGPALFVGNTSVTEVTEVGANTYRFVALTREGLQDGAPISLGWTGQPPAEPLKGDFRYELPDEQRAP